MVARKTEGWPRLCLEACWLRAEKTEWEWILVVEEQAMLWVNYVDAVVPLVVDRGRNSAGKEVVEVAPRRRCCQKRSANDRKPLALAATSCPHQRPFLDVAA